MQMFLKKVSWKFIKCLPEAIYKSILKNLCYKVTEFKTEKNKDLTDVLCFIFKLGYNLKLPFLGYKILDLSYMVQT